MAEQKTVAEVILRLSSWADTVQDGAFSSFVIHRTGVSAGPSIIRSITVSDHFHPVNAS